MMQESLQLASVEPSTNLTTRNRSTLIQLRRSKKNHTKSTDIAYYKSVDTDFNRVRDGDYSIGSWTDEHHHESFTVETVSNTREADKLQDSFTDEELLNMQKRDDTDQIQAEASWERTRSIDTRHQKSIDKLPQKSIDTNNTTDPNGYTKAIDGRTLTRQPEFGKRAYDLYGNRKFYWEEKDEYGVYRDDREFARDLDGHTIPVHTKDIRRLLEHEKNKEAFQMKLDGVYYPLNDSISWLTTCMEEMKQDIAIIQSATDVARPPSIDKRQPQ
ncbi:hypothetical protein DY000_02015587 [Brassica cretica]|uniref:Pre-mRNA-splicing factor SLU7 n=1 Tax=Brassica cretica TaxID=69181 RepID=A0ABQ7CPC9_BRACR|nr:hypothetical protein DY000_02015587 [Brassica cretica]